MTTEPDAPGREPSKQPGKQPGKLLLKVADPE